MQTHAYCYLGIGPPRSVLSISVFRKLLGSAHFPGECSLRLDSLRSHAKRPAVNTASSARIARDLRAGFSDLPAPFAFLRTLLTACELSLRRSAAAPVVAPGRISYCQAMFRL